VQDFYIWLFLLIWGLYIVAKTPDAGTGIKYYIGTILLPYFLVITFDNFKLNPKFLTRFFDVLFFSGLVLGGFSVYIYIAYNFRAGMRVPSLWNDFNIVSAYFMLLFFFNLSFLINGKKDLKMVYYSITIFFILFGIYLTKTRGVWLSIVIAIVFFFVRRPKIIIPSFILLGLFVAVFYSAVEDRVLSIMYFEQDKSSLGRLQAWYSTVLMIKDNLFFGYGFDTYILYRDEVLPFYIVPVPHPHNTYLRSIQEMGLIGSLVYYYFIFKAFICTFIKNKKTAAYEEYKKYFDALQLSFIGLFVAFMFEPYLSLFGGIALMIWILVALSFRLNKEVNNAAPVH
jgi:putative inorganic carbon (HCO3(-)) transporter